MYDYFYWDSEFSSTGEKLFKPVCFSFILDRADKDEDRIKKSVWNVEHHNLKQTRDFFNSLDKNKTVLIAFSVLAEARYLISLGIDPTEFKWIDIKVEYEQLLNSNYDFEYGRHLDEKGHVITTKPPRNKYLRTEDEDKDERSSKRAKRSLLAALYKMLNVLETSVEYKNKMRDLCIEYNVPELIKHKDQIMEYCMQDTLYLPDLLHKINTEILKRADITRDVLEKIQISRGNYVALASIRETRGYPVDFKSLKNVSDSIETIVKDLQEDINDQVKDVRIFSWNKKDQRYKTNQKNMKDFIRKNNPNWPTTDKGAISLSKDAFEKYKNYKYDYPAGDFYAQYSRFLSFNTSLNGIRKKASFKAGDRTIFDSIGSDHRCRPYAPPFNSQTSRTYPAATAFIPAKAAWMRSLIMPKPGYVCYGLDYSSQEFLIAAIESLDENMYTAYASGDPYIWLAIKAGSAPEGATKKTHPMIREVFKTLTLAINYGMGSRSLSLDLTANTGRLWKEPEAAQLISIFFEIYSDYQLHRQYIVKKYRKDGYLMLRDGWILFGDNPSQNSMLNFPFQGGAAGIMRLAEKISHKKKVKTIFTLHDALYGENKFELFERDFKNLHSSMSQAFKLYYSKELIDTLGLQSEFDYNPRQVEMAKAIRLDVNAWGEEVKSSEFEGIKYFGQDKYIDGRAKKDYEFFSKYY